MLTSVEAIQDMNTNKSSTSIPKDKVSILRLFLQVRGFQDVSTVDDSTYDALSVSNLNISKYSKCTCGKRIQFIRKALGTSTNDYTDSLDAYVRKKTIYPSLNIHTDSNNINDEFEHFTRRLKFERDKNDLEVCDIKENRQSYISKLYALDYDEIIE